MSVTTCLDHCLHLKYFVEGLYNRHISSLFFSQHNDFITLSPLLIVISRSFSVIPPHRWLQPLVGITDYIGSTFLTNHIITILIL